MYDPWNIPSLYQKTLDPATPTLTYGIILFTGYAASPGTFDTLNPKS